MIVFNWRRTVIIIKHIKRVRACGERLGVVKNTVRDSLRRMRNVYIKNRNEHSFHAWLHFNQKMTVVKCLLGGKVWRRRQSTSCVLYIPSSILNFSICSLYIFHMKICSHNNNWLLSAIVGFELDEFVMCCAQTNPNYCCVLSVYFNDWEAFARDTSMHLRITYEVYFVVQPGAQSRLQFPLQIALLQKLHRSTIQSSPNVIQS